MSKSIENMLLKVTPTLTLYAELQIAYDFFNKALFDGILPECVITLDRKRRRCMGYFARDMFSNNAEEMKDELAMNPSYIGRENLTETLSTLVHEMCHVWQHHFGDKKSRSSYHNKEWGAQMKKVGLMPSTTGKPGGAETGRQMHHYMIDGGVFEICCMRLLADDFHFSWFEAKPIQIKNSNGADKEKTKKRKYSCRVCGAVVWGKADLHIVCGKCSSNYEMD